MDSRRVGRSGLEVSRLGLGTMTWGRDTDADDAAAQLEAFVAAGGTLIDTSNVYGDGDAESIIGTLVPDVIPRADVVLATTTVGVGGARGRLLAALDGSLQRLNTDHVDLWQVHGFDTTLPFEETCSALQRAVDSGRASYIGLSGYAGWQLATMATWLRGAGCPVVATEAEYSLVERAAEESLLPAAALHGIGLLAWAPLGRGVLTGKYRHGTPADSRGASPHFARYVGRHLGPDAARIVEAVATAAEGLGTSPLAVACAWVRDRRGVASAIVGARDNAQLLGSLAATEITLPAEIRAALEDVSSPDAGDESQ
ncbi:Predicted oxidoreductase [Nakamurella panacisegetis]|uniref:Predicted oxidoreductase n=1 Tax=Nakamurella panacisegetis TaxID=1090615 RepID=A0A1H0S373_9ACTN|nr:aldo/keto reductase [Nakamurella panacisegetis]SDP35706.1 Predicted oxidoreductase [Nakamurella panacisegetis]